MHSKREKQFAGPPDECAACEVKIGGQHRPVTREYLSEIYTFCSEKCADEFLKEPESFGSSGSEEHEDE